MMINRDVQYRAKWGVLGFVLSLGGPVGYMLLLEQPFIRSTGLPAFLLLVVGVPLGIYAAAGDRRGWVRGAALLDVLILAVFSGYFFGMARLPAAGPLAGITTAPDFTLQNQEGKWVSLGEARQSGPVLLVFYRGYW